MRSKPDVVRLPQRGLVCTVTTVKDSLPNISDFVARNLRAGADHMFVFIDDADQTVYDSLEAHDHVTPVRTGAAYWQGQRPRSLNARQVTNANIVNALLCAIPRVQWLFHIDGDECLHLDKDELLSLGADIPVVQLTTWEAVSQLHWNGPVTHFKKPLTHEQLCLLTLLGIIEAPHMKNYFRGHLAKTGLRPSRELRPRIHSVKDQTGTPVDPYVAPWSTVLHYESSSGEEFVRKWMALLSSGGAYQRRQRDQLRSAIQAVVTNPCLDEERRKSVLTDLYERVIEDRFETLLELGLLATPDPAFADFQPQAFLPDEKATLERELERLCLGDKADFGYAHVWSAPAIS